MIREGTETIKKKFLRSDYGAQRSDSALPSPPDQGGENVGNLSASTSSNFSIGDTVVLVLYTVV